MHTYTKRLDRAIRRASWAHEQQNHHRKGTEIPYIAHPFGAMIIASKVTDDEDILVACLMHDVLEDVDSSIYDEMAMRNDFGDRVVNIVKDVTKDSSVRDWYECAEAYLYHLEHEASDEAIIVSTSDKIHNLHSIIMDYEVHGDDLWNRFTTKNSKDQLWWYSSVLGVAKRRNAPQKLNDHFEKYVETLSSKILS